jgi:hypothetical protein
VRVCVCAGERHVRYDAHGLQFIETIPVKRRSHESDYDTYIPQGILRQDWIIKHEKSIPALTVLVFKLEDKSADWTKLEVLVNNHTRQLRDSVRNRHGDVHIIVVQAADIPLVDEALEYREVLGERLMR